MPLGALYQAHTDRALDQLARLPPEPPRPPERSAWGAIPRGIAAAGAEVFGQLVGLDPNRGMDSRRAADDPIRVERERSQARNADLADDAGRYARSLRPDPNTAGTAEEIVFGLSRGLAKGIGSAVVLGPWAGAAAFGASEAGVTFDDLTREGVDRGTAATAAAVAGVINAGSLALPLVGSTVPRTLGLYLAGGPFGFVAQQALTREILSRADYGQIAAQYDPLDPVGLGLSTLVPLPFAGWGVARNLRARKGAGKGTAPGAEPAVAPPHVPKATQDQVDAAMVHNLTLAGERTQGRLEGVAAQISHGVSDTATGVSDAVLSAAGKVREFISGPALNKLDNRSRVVVGELDDALRQRISAESGVPVLGTEVRLRADTVRHAVGEHPDLTPDDWQVLPWLVQNFDRAVEMKAKPGDKGQRVAMVALDQATGLAYLAEVLPGGTKQGPRLNVVTFFRDSPGGIDNWLRTNGKKDDGGGSPGAGGNPRSPKPNPTGPEPTTEQPPPTSSIVGPFDQAREAFDTWQASGQPFGEWVQANKLPDPVHNLLIGLRENAHLPQRVAALERELARLEAEPGATPADATADAVQRLRSLTDEQLTDTSQPAATATAVEPMLRSVADRVQRIEAEQPDMPVGLDADGRPVSAADALARVRQEAAEGTDFELGTLDADLIRVAADCALSMGGA